MVIGVVPAIGVIHVCVGDPYHFSHPVDGGHGHTLLLLPLVLVVVAVRVFLCLAVCGGVCGHGCGCGC